jgi:heptosyltransferase-2
MKKILIIRFSSLGDVVLTSPLISSLKKRFPEHQIDFLVRDQYSELVRFNPNLSKIITFNVEEGLSGLWKLRKKIISEKYDIIFDIHNNIRSRFILYGYGIPLFSKSRILKINKNQFIRFLLVHFKINLYPKPPQKIRKVWQKYVLTGQPLGINYAGNKIELFFTLEEENFAENYLKKHKLKEKFIVVAPGAKHVTKRWPPDFFVRLIKKLNLELDLRFLLIGGSEDEKIEKEILNDIDSDRVVSIIGKTSILQTAALIKRASCFIGNDSGLLHIASAFRVPTIAIFGSTVEAFGFFPENPNAIVVENQGLKCRPCTHIGRKNCPQRHFKCLNEIEVEKILHIFKVGKFINS